MSARDEFVRHAKLWRTLEALRSARPDANDSASALAPLAPEARAIAAQNPDHSDAGRLLAAGGAAPADLSDLVGVAPGWVAPRDLERGPRLFFGLHWHIRRLLPIPMWILFVAVFVVGTQIDDLTRQALQRAVSQNIVSQAEFDKATGNDEGASDFRKALLARPAMAPLLTGLAEPNAIETALSNALLALFVAWSLLILFRRKTARILLLRRFNDQLIERRLRAFVTRTLAPYGHVYALADRYFKLTPFGRIMTFNPAGYVLRALMGIWELLRGHWNPLTVAAPGSTMQRVSSARQFTRFCMRLNDRVNANGLTMTNKRRSIIVRTSDAWWRHVVLVLMRSSDAIVMDLSDAGAGSDWEIETLQRLGLLARTVFVARQDATTLDAKVLDWLANGSNRKLLDPASFRWPESAEALAGAALTRHDLRDLQVFRFNRSGVPIDRDAFNAAFFAAISAGVRAKVA